MQGEIVSKNKWILALFAVIFLIFTVQTNVKADSFQVIMSETNANNQRSLLNDVDTVMDQNYVKQRSSHLDYGMIKLTKISATRAAIGASTQAFHVCPEIRLDIYVDKYDAKNEIWNQWRYWEYSIDNADHLTKNMEIIVPSGYYYSVRGYHICVHGEAIESIETITDGLYIGITDKPILK